MHVLCTNALLLCPYENHRLLLLKPQIRVALGRELASTQFRVATAMNCLVLSCKKKGYVVNRLRESFVSCLFCEYLEMWIKAWCR